jgi:hypothetical protein
LRRAQTGRSIAKLGQFTKKSFGGNSMRFLQPALSVAAFLIAGPALAQEPMLECIARYHTTTMVQDDFPGSLGAFRDRPCKHGVHISGVGSRAPSKGLK